jgi:polyhydroxyalkanoate synthase
MDKGTSEDENSAAPAVTLDLLSKSYRDMTRAALGFAENALTEYMDLTKKLGSVKRPDEKDEKSKIFKDPAWQNNPAFSAAKDSYLQLRKAAEKAIEEADLDPAARRKAELSVKVYFDAVAPTNFFFTNPAAIRKAFETGGLSVVAGLRNFIDDVLNNKGMPRQVDASPFEVGVNLACTPSKVIFRNELIELLQYLPQTETVYSHPLLTSPPWINKYYIMDLAPDRSFIEWAVKHGHSTFAISYRNPTKEMASFGMTDYLERGFLKALDVVSEVTGSEVVDVASLCLGGTLTTAAAAYLTSKGQGNRIGNITLLNTMVDFSDPGSLGAFTDEESVEDLEKTMLDKGYLDKDSMSRTFDFLRPADMIFNYIGPNWLMGEKPPAFDVLVWNSDSTRMPAKMHSEYLRSCYIDNRLAKGKMELAKTVLNVKDVTSPCYILSAQNDHIVPWKSAYKTNHLTSGETRYVMSNGGHIAGVVNPPSAKAWYLVGDESLNDPDEWMGGAQKFNGSWWQDWMEWTSTRSGEQVSPPTLGSKKHPAICDGPGEYVKED